MRLAAAARLVVVWAMRVSRALRQVASSAKASNAYRREFTHSLGVRAKPDQKTADAPTRDEINAWISRMRTRADALSAPGCDATHDLTDTSASAPVAVRLRGRTWL